jgi:hypothetical protein
MNQATGVRAMTAGIFQNQFLGATNGTISHLAGIEVLGVYKASTGIATITNAYGLLINNIDDYTSGFAFTNRWGIYQSGASDNNYFAGKIITGSTTVSTYQLDVTGATRMTGQVSVYATLSNSVAAPMYFSGTSNNTALNADYGTLTLENRNTTSGTYSQVLFNGGVNQNGFAGIMGILGANTSSLNYNGDILLATRNGTVYDARFRVLSNGNIIIQNGGTFTDVASAILNVSSTTRGFLPPRLTTTQKNAIATPATGLVIYDTTLNKLALYTGAAWETVTSI